MSKHNNNYTNNTIQPADDVEKEVNGAQVKNLEKVIIGSEEIKEEKPVVKEEKKEVVVEQPIPVVEKKEEVKPVQPKKEEFDRENFTVNGWKPDLSKDTKDPVEISKRASYLGLRRDAEREFYAKKR